MTTNKIIYDLLIECANKIKDCDLFELLDALNKLPININKSLGNNIVDGEMLLIHNVLMNLARENEKYKEFIDDDISFINGMTKEFHDNYFDYDKTEEDIVRIIESGNY